MEVRNRQAKKEIVRLHELLLPLPRETRNNINTNPHPRHYFHCAVDQFFVKRRVVAPLHQTQNCGAPALKRNMKMLRHPLRPRRKLQYLISKKIRLNRRDAKPVIPRHIQKPQQKPVKRRIDIFATRGFAKVPNINPRQNDLPVPVFKQFSELLDRLRGVHAPARAPRQRDRAKSALVVTPVLNLKISPRPAIRLPRRSKTELRAQILRRRHKNTRKLPLLKTIHKSEHIKLLLAPQNHINTLNTRDLIRTQLSIAPRHHNISPRIRAKRPPHHLTAVPFRVFSNRASIDHIYIGFLIKINNLEAVLHELPADRRSLRKIKFTTESV